jgi:hypothetical protein
MKERGKNVFKKKKLSLNIIFAAVVFVTALFVFLLLLTACTTEKASEMIPPSTVAIGRYYLNGDADKENAYIEIVDDNTMKFVNFDIDYLANYLLEATGYTGKDAEDFMERHNLPNVFNGEIEYEFDSPNSCLYVKALSPSNEPSDEYLTINYRMVYEDENTISFIEHKYSRQDEHYTI